MVKSVSALKSRVNIIPSGTTKDRGRRTREQQFAWTSSLQITTEKRGLCRAPRNGVPAARR